MKNKFLVKIFLPASGHFYEMRIPRQLKIAQVVAMIVSYLQKNDEGEYVPTMEAMLYDMRNGRNLDGNAFVETSGIGNGSCLMLI